MAYTTEDFARDFRRTLIKHARDLDPEDRDAIPETFSLEERLRGLDPAVVEAWLKGRKH